MGRGPGITWSMRLLYRHLTLPATHYEANGSIVIWPAPYSAVEWLENVGKERLQAQEGETAGTSSGLRICPRYGERDRKFKGVWGNFWKVSCLDWRFYLGLRIQMPTPGRILHGCRRWTSGPNDGRRYKRCYNSTARLKIIRGAFTGLRNLTLAM